MTFVCETNTTRPVFLAGIFVYPHNIIQKCGNFKNFLVFKKCDKLLFFNNISIDQVKLWLRQLQKPTDGIGNKPLALRGVVTSMADATDFCFDLEQININTVKKSNIR